MPHVRGQRRSPSKTVGGANSRLESNPVPARDAQRAQTNLCAPGPGDPTETETAFGGPGRQWSAAGTGALGVGMA